MLLGFVVACGGGDDDPRPVDASAIPEGAVAIVGDEPITMERLERRLAAVRRSRRPDSRRTRLQLRQQALTTLLQQAALEQELEQAGLRVTDAEVRERFDRARGQFRSRRAYRRFLGNQTTADLLFQLRMQVLAEKVGAAAREAGEEPGRFATELQRRWADRTACREGYTSALCGS